MTAQYSLEAVALAVDARRTRFALLDGQDLQSCSKPSLGFCSIKSPIYPVNLNKFCVVALFMQNRQAVELTCQTQVRLKSAFPMAEYTTDGVWCTSKTLRLNLVCKDSPTAVLNAHPPISLIKLNMSCTASSNQLYLTPYSEQESVYESSDPMLSWIKNYALSNVTLWLPFQKSISPGSKLALPKEMHSLQNIIPMHHLIAQLRHVDTVSQNCRWSLWRYLIVVTLGCLILSVAGVVVYFVYLHIVRTQSKAK